MRVLSVGCYAGYPMCLSGYLDLYPPPYCSARCVCVRAITHSHSRVFRPSMISSIFDIGHDII